jgi:hypothetical protein
MSTRTRAPSRRRVSPLRRFQLVLLIVTSLTVLSLGVSLFLSFLGPLTPQQASLFETCSSSWKMGFGAIVGLVGGNALHNSGRSR